MDNTKNKNWYSIKMRSIRIPPSFGIKCQKKKLFKEVEREGGSEGEVEKERECEKTEEKKTESGEKIVSMGDKIKMIISII